MTTELLGIVVNDAGQPILPPASNKEGRKAFFKLFFETESGKKVVDHMTPEAEARISEVILKWFGPSPEITLERLTKVVDSLVAVRDPALFPPEPEVTPTPERPRDPEGRFLSEYELWCADPNRSMKQIRDRAATDRNFGEWYRATVVAQTIQEGAYRVLGGPSRTPTEADEQLLGDFVRAYQTTPTAQMRPTSGLITLNNGKKYTVSQFNSFVERAANAGLI